MRLFRIVLSGIIFCSISDAVKDHPDLATNFKISLQIDEIGKDFVKYKMEFIDGNIR